MTQPLNYLFQSSKERREDLQLVGSVEVRQGLLDPGGHRLLTLANPYSWVEVLLVGLVLAVGVADLLHHVVLLVEHVVADTGEVCVPVMEGSVAGMKSGE